MELVQEKNIFSREEVTAFATCSADIRDRALFVTLYLTNSRVSEIVRRLKKTNITFNDDNKGNRVLLFTELYTEKRSDHPLRTIPVPINDREKPLIDVLLNYMSVCQTDVLFPISRQRAWTILKHLSGERCHFLRHTRLSHLVVEYGLNETALMRLAGWKSRNMLDVYAHIGWNDISLMMQ